MCLIVSDLDGPSLATVGRSALRSIAAMDRFLSADCGWSPMRAKPTCMGGMAGLPIVSGVIQRWIGEGSVAPWRRCVGLPSSMEYVQRSQGHDRGQTTTRRSFGGHSCRRRPCYDCWAILDESGRRRTTARGSREFLEPPGLKPLGLKPLGSNTCLHAS
jgi:hypothetical protein